jgi:hypothetical protein
VGGQDRDRVRRRTRHPRPHRVMVRDYAMGVARGSGHSDHGWRCRTAALLTPKETRARRRAAAESTRTRGREPAREGAALQAYLDQMGELVLDKESRTSYEDAEVRALVRAWTLTVLEA